ncbi:DUF3048 domain-containing protein [Virgibacillus sp. DJP39]|uniref:DUF3048 domain-containing protein n=1 Tax=Virgibacillus sp. DJP39 TaxID=3409790 RepID=UPI003BB6F3FB
MKIKIPLAILTLLLLILAGCNKDTDTQKPAQDAGSNEIAVEVKEVPEIEVVPKSPTTGLPVRKDDAEMNSFAVMVENSPKARPHTGLVDADVVYEMEVEGNVTRFLAIFNDHIPEKVGPVRSSRHYYLPIAESWNVPYIHFGGSPQAYARLGNLSVPTIDGIYQAKYFERDNSRYAPHNAYLYTSRLSNFEQELMNDKFEFDENASYENSSTSTAVNITYNNFTRLTHQYDSESNLYNRYLEGKPHYDRETGEQIKANNVIVMYAGHHAIPGDKAGRIDVTLTGEGEAEFFLDGQVVKGKWKNEENNLRFYVGNDIISLNPGKTWIQVVNVNKKSNVTY